MSKEKPTDFFADVSEPQSAWAYALALQQACAKVGFDWSQPMQVLDKVKEEIDEVKTELTRETLQPARLEEEIGDAFFALTNLARHCNVDAERALNTASEKFKGRFELVCRYAAGADRKVKDYTLPEFEQLWEKAKQAGAEISR